MVDHSETAAEKGAVGELKMTVEEVHQKMWKAAAESVAGELHWWKGEAVPLVVPQEEEALLVDFVDENSKAVAVGRRGLADRPEALMADHRAVAAVGLDSVLGAPDQVAEAKMNEFIRLK